MTHRKRLMLLATVIVSALVSSILFAGEPGVNYFINSDGSVGMVLELKRTLASSGAVIPDAFVDLDYAGEAIIGSKADSLPNHVDFKLSGVGRFPDWPFNSWVFRVRVPGLGIEATQDFRKIDLAGSCQLALAHPHLLDILYRLIAGRPPAGGNPTSIGLEYAYVTNLEEAALGPGWHHRIDTDVFVSLPLTDFFGLALRGRAYGNGAKPMAAESWKGMLEAVARVKWSGTWLFIKYEHGGLPPIFTEVSSWSTGVGFAFE